MASLAYALIRSRHRPWGWRRQLGSTSWKSSNDSGLMPAFDHATNVNSLYTY